MPEHFSKSVVEATVWCSKCNGPTLHSIFDGRRGACLVCFDKLPTPSKSPPTPPAQRDLFDPK